MAHDFIKGICHFGLSVSDLADSIRFYSEVLGLPMAARRENDAFFRVGERDVLALIQHPGGAERFAAEMRPKHRGKAFTHFGLAAESAEAVFAFQDHLKACGVEIVKEAYRRWDGASLYFLDPDGYTLEYMFYQPEDQP